MNILDLVIIILIALCVMSAYSRGLIKAVFNLFSWVISIILSNSLYPFVSKILRNTTIYTNLKGSLMDSLGLEAAVKTLTSKAQADLINSMSAPDFIKISLLKNNNPEIYKILNVSGIEEYIAGYMANIFINIISMIFVFCIVFFLMRILSSTLDIISKLPVINAFNKAGGALVGFLNATIIIWIIMTCAVFFVHGDNYMQIFVMINNSLLARLFYETNIILNFILKVAA